MQLILALGAPWIAPYDPMAQSVARRLRGPTALNWLGTDQLGRDVLTRILYGYRTSLIACVNQITTVRLTRVIRNAPMLARNI